MPNCELAADEADPRIKRCVRPGCGREIVSDRPAAAIFAQCGRYVPGPTLAASIAVEPRPRADGDERPCAGCKAENKSGGYGGPDWETYSPKPGVTLPAKWRLAWNYAKALAKRAANPKHVTVEEYAARIAVCDRCPLGLRVEGRCTHKDCGCVLAEKARWASEDCPERLWPKLPAVATSEAVEGAGVMR